MADEINVAKLQQPQPTPKQEETKEIIYGMTWRPIGNSIEKFLNMYKHVVRNNIDISKVKTVYGNDFHKDILKCIPGLKEENMIKKGMFDFSVNSSFTHGWDALRTPPHLHLEIPKDYKNKFNLPIDEKIISIQIREPSGRGQDWDGGNYNNHEPERFVNPLPFFNLALKYAKLGYKIIQIGDNNSTPFPDHPNIIKLSHFKDKTLLDDMFAIANSSVMLGTDSSMWVAGVALGTPTILSNSCHTIPRHWPWEEGHKVLLKKLWNKNLKKYLTLEEIKKTTPIARFKGGAHLVLEDNTFEELDDAVKEMLKGC